MSGGVATSIALLDLLFSQTRLWVLEGSYSCDVSRSSTVSGGLGTAGIGIGRPGAEDIPFIIALQDFHAPQAMSRIIMPATEYVFGVRHSIVGCERRIERIHKHVYRQSHEPSYFFGLPESENVSAVMLNPVGTIPKFNRMGFRGGLRQPPN